MVSEILIGHLVLHPQAPGIARVADVTGDQVRMDLFESAAQPVAESRWVPLSEVRRVRLSPQTRVFFEDGRQRWERPPCDPLQVLLTGANETPRYRDAREPVRRLLLAERSATASATGIMSAGVRLHAHQISAALRIIRDPVQRYLLADEVGMGKTILWGSKTRLSRHRCGLILVVGR